MSESLAKEPSVAMKPYPKSRRKLIIIVVSVVTVIVLGLALGIGLGLGLRHDSDSDEPSTLPSPTSPPTPAGNGTWWRPSKGTTWQIQISGVLNNTSFDVAVYDIDLFLNNASTIANLHSQGRKVICYFSAGSYEDFRPDKALFAKSDYGKPLDGWPGEWWLDTKSTNVRNIMLTRLERAASLGCDAVDPDNVDAYDNDTGLGLTKADAVDYLTFLANAAHGHGLGIGLKNGGDIVPQIIDRMEFQVNEQCVQYSECNKFQPFIAANKPVFHIEYPQQAPSISDTARKDICSNTQSQGFSTLLKELSLNDWVVACS